ncbi:MAG TPA: CopD family protein [Solirubrobacteraceae bacterium]|jgi:copper transport protein|nr:CopD family protein [Solirubrobacteraceae bacterium]
MFRSISSRLTAAVTTACIALLATAPAATAHAQLLGTSPVSGTTVAVAPREVIFKFNESVGGTLGAVRVYDAQGREVDDLKVSHPDGQQHWMGVGLETELPAGTYTATYRVISADTHVVFGGLVFNVGHPSASSKVTVAGLIERNESGHVTKVAFGVVRALDYLSIALMLGGLAFLLVAWLPALRAVGGEDAHWREASQALARRLRALLLGAAALGVAVSVLGFLLQGASASGVSLWSSLKGTVLSDTLDSRFGTVWAARAGDWVLLGGLALLASKLRGRRRWIEGPIALGAAYLALTPALSGHASIESPRGVFFPADVLHVLAASVWVGGIACLLLALPAATRRLPSAERGGLLLATLERFSPLALASVIAIAATGVLQAYIDVRSLHGLFHTTYGWLIVVKTVLLLGLIGLGWVNRERVLPSLRRLVRAHRAPGETGVLARRTLRGELVAMVAVLGATAALISYTPPIDAEAGPFSADTTLGSAELEMTVEPAEVGANTIHLYLIDARTGTQFTASKELTATASLPSKGIGPLPLKATLAGPGHYVFNSAVLSPAGSWRIAITDRVSEFEQHTRTITVPVAGG